MQFLTRMARPLGQAIRPGVITARYSSTYPFSQGVTIIEKESPTAETLEKDEASTKRTTSLLKELNTHLTSYHPNSEEYLRLFSRRDKNRIRPGSVLTVTSYVSVPTQANPTPQTNSFSGVLIGVRRRHQGRDLAFRLRALVGRVGVEQYYKVFSPLIQSIAVVAPATRSGPAIVNSEGQTTGRRKPALKAARRAKLFYLRDQLNRLPNVANYVKQYRTQKK